MEQLLFIVLAVVIIFALLYKWKKRTEKKMGNDLNALIEANDWRGVCRILRKQLIVWRTRQTLWRAVQMLTQKLSCQTIHDCPKVVPLHYESEWQ